MYALISPFVRLCLLNASPQDLPASTVLLALCLSADALVTTLIAMPVYSFSLSVTQAMVEISLLLGYTGIALRIRANPERYVQTVSALAGVGVIIGVLALPLVYSLFRSASHGSADPFALFVYLMAFAWLLVVYGHIYRHALSTGMVMGVLVAFGYVMLTSLAIEAVFPMPGPN